MRSVPVNNLPSKLSIHILKLNRVQLGSQFEKLRGLPNPQLQGTRAPVQFLYGQLAVQMGIVCRGK